METFDRIWIDAGGTNVRAIGESKGKRRTILAVRATPGAVAAVARRARARLSPAGEIVAGLRGVWTPAEKASCGRSLRKAAGPRLRVMSDIELAHAMAFGDGPGIVLNAGTGSIAYGRNAKGKTARAGGLGPLLGDEGSAFWIGLEYVRRVESRKMPFASLRKLAKSTNPVAAVAAHARKALRAAPKGGEARRIVQEARGALRGLVREVQRKLGGGRFPVILRGGLFEDNYFRRRFHGR